MAVAGRDQIAGEVKRQTFQDSHTDPLAVHAATWLLWESKSGSPALFFGG
jgi:hypothetical protein